MNIRKLAAAALFTALTLGATSFSTYAEQGKTVQTGKQTATSQVGAQAVINDSSNVVVYFIPHPGDETLSFAADIRNRIYQGNEVHLVLMSAGEHSGARDVINGEADAQSRSHPPGTKITCSWHGKQHNPNKEPWESVEQFGKLRLKEFQEAAAKLGVPAQNVHIYMLEDANFDRAQVKNIFLQFKDWYPNASFRTMSKYDNSSPDYSILGDVLAEMEQEGTMDPAKTIYFISLYKARFGTLSDVPVTLYNGIFLNGTDSQYVSDAVNNVYKKYDVVNGYYGVGYHSVPLQFDSLMNDMKVKYHY